MAWTERLPSGKYRGCWRDPSGTKCYTRRPEFPEHPYSRKRDALEAAQEAEVTARRQAAAERGTISASITFGEWWATGGQPVEGDSNTADNARRIGRNYLLPKWEDTPLNRIEQREAKAWILDLLPGREISYVRRIWAEFRRTMNLAVEKGPLTASPCVGVKLPKARRKARAASDEQYLDKIRPFLHDFYADMNRVALDTGLRPGELCGLHADALDLDEGWVSVEAVYVRKRNVIRSFPKDKDARPVPLTEDAVRIIRARLAGRDLTAGCGVPHVGGRACRGALVFTNRERRVVTQDAWQAAMRRAADAAEVRARSPYALRRGFATRAARGGVDAFELAEIMGHADVRQTREYVQQSPAARDRLRAALGGGGRLRVVRDAG